MSTRLLLLGAILAGASLSGCFSKSSSGSAGGASFDGGSADASFPDGSFPGDGSIPDGGFPTGVLSTAPVDFGPTPCGTAPASKSYTFQNSGPQPITWSASVNSIFSITAPSSGTVAPGQSETLTVTASAVPTTSDPGVPITGTLSLTTNVPGYTSIQVPLTVEPQGGSLFASLTPIAFGTTELSSPSTLSFSLTNLGNQPVSVTFGDPTDSEFALSYTGSPSTVTIAPGSSLPQSSATFTPTSAGPKSGTIAIQTTDAVCASAASLSLTGTATSEPVSINPGSLQFGSVSCGATAAPQMVTIRNGYGTSVSYAAALGLGAGSPYALSSASGSIPAQGQTTITVTPAAIPADGNTTAGAYDDSLTITFPGLTGSQPTVLDLTESASGALLAIQMATTSFGMVTTTAQLPFTVTNTGNIPAPLTVQTTGPGFQAGFSGSNVAPQGGAPLAGIAALTPTAAGTLMGTLSVTTTVALCGPLPQAIALSGTANIPIASYSNATIEVGSLAQCESSPASFTITNNGDQPLTISNVLSVNNFFTVDMAPTTIAPGTSGTIVISENFDAARCEVNADTLEFTTNEPGGPTHEVSVSVNVDCDC